MARDERGQFARQGSWSHWTRMVKLYQRAKRAGLYDGSLKSWMEHIRHWEDGEEEKLERIILSLEKLGESGLNQQVKSLAKSLLKAREHWITIGSSNSGSEEGKGRHVLIDESGKIVGGNVPKEVQGKNVKTAFRQKEQIQRKKPNKPKQLDNPAVRERIRKWFGNWGENQKIREATEQIANEANGRKIARKVFEPLFVDRFYDEGKIPVVGARYGDAPESERSFNTRENGYEKGVSMLQVNDLPGVNSFAVSGSKHRAIKYYFGNAITSTGGDNEILMRDLIPITKEEYETFTNSPEGKISSYAISFWNTDKMAQVGISRMYPEIYKRWDDVYEKKEQELADLLQNLRTVTKSKSKADEDGKIGIPDGLFKAYDKAYRIAHRNNDPDEEPRWSKRAEGLRGQVWRAADGWGEMYFHVFEGKITHLATRWSDVMAYSFNCPKFKEFVKEQGITRTTFNNKLGLGDVKWDALMRKYVDDSMAKAQQISDLYAIQAIEKKHKELGYDSENPPMLVANADYYGKVWAQVWDTGMDWNVYYYLLDSEHDEPRLVAYCPDTGNAPLNVYKEGPKEYQGKTKWPQAIWQELVNKFVEEKTGKKLRKSFDNTPGLKDFPKVMAVDFDGTVTTGEFPELGEPRRGVKEALDWFKENGGTIIIWTCRAGKDEKKAKRFLEKHGIPFDYLNENIPGLGFETSRKIYADLYVDDRGYFPGWPELLKDLQNIKKEIRKSAKTDDLMPSGGVPWKRVYDYLSQNYPAETLEWVKNNDWHYYPRIPLSKIKMARRPGGRNIEKVESIAQAIGEGKKMEPIVLVQTKSGYDVADGYHRTLGFKHAGKKTIEAFVCLGAAEHGPWEKEMHEKKLNKSLHQNEESGKVIASRKEADEWVKGSAISVDLYHGTKKEAAESIKREGFKLSHLGENTTLAGVYGAGIYFTSKPEHARFYGKSVLTVKVKVKNPAYADDMVKIILGVKKKTGKDYAMGAVKDYSKSYGAEQLTEYLKEAGFDCIISVPKQFGIKNAPEIVIFDSKDIMIIDEEIRVQKSVNPLLARDNLLSKSFKAQKILAMLRKERIKKSETTISEKKKTGEEGRWITIHPNGTAKLAKEGTGSDEGTKDYRRIKIDSEGRIVGGDVPREKQGKKISEAFQSKKEEHKDKTKTHDEFSSEWYHPSQVIRVKASKTGSVKVNGTIVKSAQDVADMFSDLTDADREKVFVVAVNRRGGVIGAQCVHIGAVSSSIVSPKDVLKLPILSGASGLYVMHNHPSGNPEPSKEDIEVTKKLNNAVSDSGLKLYGHIVMGETYSLINNEGYIVASKMKINKPEEKTKTIPLYETSVERRQNKEGKPTINSPNDVIDYMVKAGIDNKEGSYFLLLDTKNSVLGAIPFDPTNQRPEDVKKLAIHAMVKGNTTNIIIATGNKHAYESFESIGLKRSAKELGVNLLDVLVKKEGRNYASMVTEGKLDMFKGGDPVQKMVKVALNDEEEAISFYRQMLKTKGLSDEDRRIILNILSDEKRHAEVLSEMLSDMEKARSKEEWAEVKRRKEKEYEGVDKFADPEHDSYPIDTEEHVRAALGYINQERNASKYSKDKLSKIRARIERAAKRYGIKIAG